MTTDKSQQLKIEPKPYRCQRCGHTKEEATNHYGEFYDRCKKCSWKNPMDPVVTWECVVPLDERPEDAWVPEPWKKCKLSDVCTIRRRR